MLIRTIPATGRVSVTNGIAAAGNAATKHPDAVRRVLAWMGSAMFAAFALGAPAGTALYRSEGFMGIALATTLLPLGRHPELSRCRCG